MINKIKKWFKNPFSVEALQERSGSILSVFHKTVNELVVVNSEISDEIIDKEEMIKSLNEDKITLETLKESNEKVITKITEFLK